MDTDIDANKDRYTATATDTERQTDRQTDRQIWGGYD